MKKWLLLLLAVLLALSLCACRGDSEEAAAEAADAAASETAEQAEATDDAATETSEGTEAGTQQAAEPSANAAGDAAYEVELKDGLVLTNYEGDEVFAVFYSFTNGGDKPTNASLVLDVAAYQLGAELEEGALADSDLPGEWAGAYTNTWSYAEPGATLDCCEAFILKSDNDVEVEITEFEELGGRMLANQTFAAE